METTLITNDTELTILENIYSSQRRERELTQRDLALAAGLSLGMINTLLKRFAEKGWILLHKVNSRNIQYSLTQTGMNEIAHRTYRYFKRTAQTASLYRDMIESYVLRAKHDGKKRLVLAGSSDLDFLIEYACERHSILFVKATDPEKAKKLGNDKTTEIIIPESHEKEIGNTNLADNEVSLSRILVGY